MHFIFNPEPEPDATPPVLPPPAPQRPRRRRCKCTKMAKNMGVIMLVLVMLIIIGIIFGWEAHACGSVGCSTHKGMAYHEDYHHNHNKKFNEHHI